MLPHEYEKMHSAEDVHWWFRALHFFIFQILSLRDQNGPGSVLDIGCGTGGLLQKIATQGYQATGVDISRVALDLSRARQITSLARSDANFIPFAPSTFDLVTCVDVLEIQDVSPELVIRQAHRVLKPGGYMLISVAAHQWLLSKHDRAVYSVQRLSRKQLAAYFAYEDIEIIYSSYLFFLLFPLMAIWKLLNRFSNNVLESDVALPPRWINWCLLQICLLEGSLLPRISLPIGTSSIILAKKSLSNDLR